MRIPKSWTKSNVNKFIEEKDENDKVIGGIKVSLNLSMDTILKQIYVKCLTKIFVISKNYMVTVVMKINRNLLQNL